MCSASPTACHCAAAQACTLTSNSHQLLLLLLLLLQALLQLLLHKQPLQHCCLSKARHACSRHHAQLPQLHHWQQHGTS
jgi:hypothetical protein